MIEVIFTPEEIERIKERCRSDFRLARRRGLVPKFVSEYDWAGYLAIEAIKREYSWLEDITRPGKIDSFDLKFKGHAGYRIEVKTVTGNAPFKEYYDANFNLEQFTNSKAQIIIFCYYQRGDNKIVIVGWEWAEEFMERAVLVREREMLGSGRPAKADFLKLPFFLLRDMEELTLDKIMQERIE